MQIAPYIGIENVEVIEDDSAGAWALWDIALVQGDLPEASHSAARDVEVDAIAPEDRALDVINKYHSGVAQAIRAFWGHHECCAYIESLLLSGTNAQRQNRSGFNQEVAACMLLLINIHEQLFGSLKDRAAVDAPSWF